MRHFKGERRHWRNYQQDMTKWLKHNHVTKPLLGGQTPNRVKIMDGATISVLAGICKLSVKEFCELYG